MNAVQKQFAKLKHRQFLLYLLVFSLVTIILWIGTSLLFSQKRTGIPSELLELAKPLTPTIDEEVLQRIEQKRNFTDSELTNFPINKVIRNKEGKVVGTTEDASTAPQLLPKSVESILQSNSPAQTTPSTQSATSPEVEEVL